MVSVKHSELKMQNFQRNVNIDLFMFTDWDGTSEQNDEKGASEVSVLPS